jgi:hypothetical protein
MQRQMKILLQALEHLGPSHDLNPCFKSVYWLCMQRRMGESHFRAARAAASALAHSNEGQAGVHDRMPETRFYPVHPCRRF